MKAYLRQLRIKQLSLIFGTLFLFIVKAAGTTYPVNTYSSLTSAIAAAVDGDIISVTANIVVTAEVPIGKTLTINGNNYNVSVPVNGVTNAGILAGSPSAFRVFNINTSGKTVVINNLVIKGGATSTNGGTVIIAAGAIARFNSCTISNGKGPSSSGGGGGISNNGTCYLFKTDIKRNAGGYAGGFLNYGTMFIEYSAVTDNRGLCSGCGGGGGVNFNSAARMYINNSTFANNKSTELGGAFENFNGAIAYVINTSFTGNVAYGALKGGAIAQNSTGGLYCVNCLFGYNYYTNNSGTSYILDDVHAYAGTANLYYCTYMANSVNSGTVSLIISNNLHTLVADGSNNDLFTGGVFNKLTDASGNNFGSASVFQPFQVNIGGHGVPTLKTGSYALAKGCNAGFTNGSGTPVIGYQNMSTSTWVNIVGTGAAAYQVTDDQTNTARATPPAAGAAEKMVDNYVILKVGATANGTVDGASIYGDVYPSGTVVTITGIPNAGYALTDWTYNFGGTGTVSGNPLSLTLTQNTSLTPNYTTSTNYTITYLANASTGGTPPAIASYASGNNGTIAANSGSLEKSGFTFAGWNTLNNGSGTNYAVGATYSANSNLVLYAAWTSMGLLLDVRVISFSATPASDNKEIILDWQTASETNSDYFELQRSENCGNNWEFVGNKKAAGLSSTGLFYTYTDKHPYNGTSCYRLKQIDKDGKFIYLPVITVRLKNYLTSGITLYPNPATTVLYLTGSNIGIAANISVLNMLGQNITKLCRITRQTETKYVLDVSKLTAGIYLIKTNNSINKIDIR